MVWPTFSFKIQTSNHAGEKRYLWKSSTDCSRSCRRGWNVIGSSHTILMEDLGMHQVSENFVPRLLTDDQNCSENIRQRANYNENIFKNVITGDETWVYGYDIETKQESSPWKSSASPHPKKTQEVHL
jgi:hypothetical protein